MLWDCTPELLTLRELLTLQVNDRFCRRLMQLRLTERSAIAVHHDGLVEAGRGSTVSDEYCDQETQSTSIALTVVVFNHAEQAALDILIRDRPVLLVCQCVVTGSLQVASG